MSYIKQLAIAGAEIAGGLFIGLDAMKENEKQDWHGDGQWLIWSLWSKTKMAPHIRAMTTVIGNRDF